MFSKIIKDFFLKKIVSKKLLNDFEGTTSSKIESVGVIIDDAFFSNKEALKKEITQFGISENNITILVFKKKINKKEVVEEPFFTLKDLKIDGNSNKKEVQDFISYPFDLLINYYEVEKPSLLLISSNSKAKFKIGFASIDKRVNHFIIKLHVNQHKEFVSELFKYLKILNKL